MIVFTSDIDWAPEEVIADTLNLFEVYGVKCTFFSTHHSLELTKSNKKLFEIGIHPNFNPILNGSSDKRPDDILDEIMDIHPEAQGIRSHSMLQSTNLLQLFAERKLLYDANHFMPYHTDIKPFRLWNGMIRIPYNWEDDVHWAYGYSFDSSGIELDPDKLIVFDFHPIHIFLNTENKYRYNEAKKFYQDPKTLLNYRNKEVVGTRDLLISLLTFCKQNKNETFKMTDVAIDFTRNNP
ncbi:MAG TPA: hypothetical protein PK753_04960 [Ignavibacteria bacterium]|nr:hypothetical protein [Ignavibacteria bacterium]